MVELQCLSKICGKTSNGAMGHLRPSNSASGRAFVGYAPDSDRRRCNAANDAKRTCALLRPPVRAFLFPATAARIDALLFKFHAGGVARPPDYAATSLDV